MLPTLPDWEYIGVDELARWVGHDDSGRFSVSVEASDDGLRIEVWRNGRRPGAGAIFRRRRWLDAWLANRRRAMWNRGDWHDPIREVVDHAWETVERIQARKLSACQAQGSASTT